MPIIIAFHVHLSVITLPLQNYSKQEFISWIVCRFAVFFGGNQNSFYIRYLHQTAAANKTERHA